IKAGVVDKVLFFLSPMLLGGDAIPAVGEMGIRKIAGGISLKGLEMKKIGRDILVEGKLTACR
ncbi:MAG: dihydrofolate reductase family protein, partial [Thermodesulfobacteriota bacterium]